MKAIKSIFFIMLALAAGLFLVTAAQAAITATGNVEPTTDPSTWSGSSTYAYIGNTAVGSLAVNGGSMVASYNGYVGNTAGVTGTVNIDGAGSTWNLHTVGGEMSYVGYNGAGIVNITNGGQFANNILYLARNAGASGIINVSGGGSALSTGRLYVGYSGAGLLTVTNGGTLVSSGGSESPQIGKSSGTSGRVIIDGAGSTWTDTTWTGVNIGYSSAGSTGTLSITNGGTVNFITGLVSGPVSMDGTSCMIGSYGTVTVDGAGSSWNISGDATTTDSGNLRVGYRLGSGARLIITNGGSVTNNTGYVGYQTQKGTSKSTGTVTVDGAGSTWTNNGTLYVGYGSGGSYTGSGSVSITNGGFVAAPTLNINSYSTLTTDIGYGSTLSVGSGGITNNGTIRLAAGAGTGTGTYAPIFNAGSWSGNTPQALGGVWNDANHTVTVNAAATGTAGTPTTFDLAAAQRVLITDPANGHSVGAAFQATTAPTNLTITATAIADLAGLKGQLAAGKAVLSAWSFTATGTTISESNPVYLSLFAGPDQSLSALGVWHYDGSTWSAFTANDLAYDGTYASFTVTGFSGYALSGTAPVPIPAAVWLFGPALTGIGFMRKRIFKA